MTVPDKPAPVSATCMFAVQRLSLLLAAFEKEIAGVKAADDIEPIHRMRVASRRLRAALPLFESCFPQKKYRRWMQEIKTITQSLGAARDTDVQIAFLEKIIRKKNRQAKQAGGENEPVVREAGDPAGVEQVLLSSLKKKRAGLQKDVLRTLAALEKSRVIPDMEETFRQMGTPPVPSRRQRPRPYGIAPVAAGRISDRLTTLLEFSPWVHNPDAVAEHHATRIAAKKLRYTMEVYSPVYRLGLRKPLARVKKIQEILGDIHDCDVWIDTVTLLLLKERSEPRFDRTAGTQGTGRIAGLRQFLLERERERRTLYRRFVFLWDSLARTRLWDELRQSLLSGCRTKFAPRGLITEDTILAQVLEMRQVYPEGERHSDRVTALALSLLDCLAPLYPIDDHTRFMFRCAALLHDIGWHAGQKGHAARSREMIIAHEQLLLTVAERGIVGLVAGAHRGKARPVFRGIFTLLSPGRQQDVLVLSAILRVADGLDFLHTDSVKSLSCTITEHEIVIHPETDTGAGAEIGRAYQKADLLRQIFSRELVIA